MTDNEILSSKKIIFVDDRYEINKRYIDAIKKKGATCVYINNIIDAINHLTTQTYDFAVIDLHMEIPSSFPETIDDLKEEFYSIINPKREMNGGQMVGIYINTKLENKIKFVYLSAVGANYIKIKNGEPYGENICYDKYETGPLELADVIIKGLLKA